MVNHNNNIATANTLHRGAARRAGHPVHDTAKILAEPRRKILKSVDGSTDVLFQPKPLKLNNCRCVLSVAMSDEKLIEKMRNRVAQCRRLANWVTDPHTRAVLNQMADEGETDLRQFEADHGGQDNDRREG